MSLVRRFLTGFLDDEPDPGPGLVMRGDTVYLVKPDGTEIDLSTGGGGGNGSLHSVATALTDAQIKALPTAPIQLLAAPGASMAYVPIFVLLRLVNPVDYTNVSAGAYLTLDTSSGGEFMDRLDEANNGVSNFLGSGLGDAWATLSIRQGVPSAPPVFTVADTPEEDAGHINVNLRLKANNSGGNFTGGDPANAMTVTVAYFLFDATTGEFV